MAMEDDKSPKAETVADFHNNADTDASRTALHHTLGPGRNQAASGAHTHDGNDSPRLLSGVQINGADTNAVLESVVSAIVRLGAEDKRSTDGTGGD